MPLNFDDMGITVGVPGSASSHPDWSSLTLEPAAQVEHSVAFAAEYVSLGHFMHFFEGFEE